MTKHSKQEQLLIEKDERLIRDLLHNLYERKLKGGGLSGGSFADFGKAFLHGFTVPFKEFGGVLDMVLPGSGVIASTLANAIDKAVPGARYASMGDVFAGKKIEGTGMGRGRPRKVRVEPHVTVVKKARGRPKKVATPCECN